MAVKGLIEMQCKDIPTVGVLRRLRDIHSRGHTWGLLLKDHSCGESCMMPGFPDVTPYKLMLAKLYQTKLKGLIDGCDCGCRGDWELTEKGEKRLFELEGANV